MGHYNDALVQAHVSTGNHVEVITSSAPPSLEDGPLLTVRSSRFLQIALNRSAPKAIRAGAYLGGLAQLLVRALIGSDAVVLHFFHWPTADLMAMRLLKRAKRRVIIVAHDPVPVTERQQDIAWKKGLRLADVVVVHGPAASAAVLSLGVSSSRVLVCRFGDYLAARALSPDVACDYLGISRHLQNPIALIVGNLRSGKGIERAVTGVGGAHEIGTLLVAGARQGDWDLDRALRLPAGSPVTLTRIERRLTDQEELAAYSLADVVLALYESAYSSAVIARAHSLGKPVVLTDVGDLRQQAMPHDVVIRRDYSKLELNAAIRRCLARSRPKVEPSTVTDLWLAHARAVTSALGIT
jgi:glycosyltransferase involved in cell wall biosynthesis